ncbi:MAG: hypothetical protein DMG17_10390 [Acidobacteria bacterium]|nr:MAG: hypothetical protein DMG17_10390 [Acidobacteriota bacterium]
MKGSGDKTVIVLSGRLVAVSTRKTLRVVTDSGAFELSEGFRLLIFSSNPNHLAHRLRTSVSRNQRQHRMFPVEKSLSSGINLRSRVL